MISGGTPTGLMSVRLLVRVKYAKGMIPPQHMLPEMFEGMHVDVEEVGTFRPMTSVPNPRTMIRPAQPGSSIGFEFPGGSPIMAGTFGGLVRDETGIQYLLSNSHVLANEGQLAVGSRSGNRRFQEPDRCRWLEQLGIQSTRRFRLVDPGAR
jgi:hypothetical protein